MSLYTQGDDESQYIFVAKLDNARNLSHLLKAVHFKETAVVYGSSHGLKVTVETARCLQANAFIQADIFQEYTLSEDSVTFRINLTVLLECLNIFGNSNNPGITTSLKMCYAGYGSPLILLLEEGGVLTDCTIKTMDPDDILDFDFSTANVVNKVIMKSECLKEAFNEMDTSSEVLQILVSPDKPHLRLSTFGEAGSTHADYPKDSDMMESFHCTQTQSYRYKIALLKAANKALTISQKISIRIDDHGFLCLQYMIKTEDGHVCFVEYYCAPVVDTEDNPEY